MGKGMCHWFSDSKSWMLMKNPILRFPNRNFYKREQNLNFIREKIHENLGHFEKIGKISKRLLTLSSK